MTTTHQVWIAIMVLVCMAGASQSARAATNMWSNTSGDSLWATASNWNPANKPGVTNQARFASNISGLSQYAIYTVTNNGAESVDSVAVDPAAGNMYNSPTWLGSGSLNVAHDFSYLSTTMASNYFKPTLTLNGMFYTSPAITDYRTKLKFGDSTSFTSGNNFVGGIYNNGMDLYIGGNTTFGNNSTLMVAGTTVIGILDVLGHHVQIQGTPSFGTNMTFDLRRGGTLWFPTSATFDNVSTLRFNGGLLQLDATNLNTFPTYANGFEVKRGLLAITNNGSLGATDANAITLGSTGGFGYLMGAAANSAGNYITRPITLTGNGGFVNVQQTFYNNDMNFATPITGAGMLIKTGNKTLYLRNAGSSPAASSYSGGTVIADGILSVESARTLGSGNVAILAGGKLDFTNAATIAAGANVLPGGSMYSAGVLHMLADLPFPTINTNATGVVALEIANTHTIASIGSAFIGAANNSARYSGTSLPAGPDHIYRIGGTMDLLAQGGSSLNLDVNGATNGAGVLTGNNDVLIAYGGCYLRDLNDFTGSLTVRRNVQYNTWTGVWCQPEFQTGGSPLGSATGAVNLYYGGLYFYNVNNGLPITKGALNVQGQDYIYADASSSYNETDLTFDSLNRTNRAQLSITDLNLKLGTPDAGHGNKMVKFLVTNSAPTPTNNIVAPWLTYGWGAGAGTFLTYGANGFSTQGCFSVTVPAGSFPSGLTGGTNVVQVTGAVSSMSDDPDIYALRADDAISGATNTITLRSGGLILNSASTHSMKLKFGAGADAEGIVFCTAPPGQQPPSSGHTLLAGGRNSGLQRGTGG